MIELDSFMKVINYLLNEEIHVDQSVSSVSRFILKRIYVHIIGYFSSIFFI
jgi:hypothetical protein